MAKAPARARVRPAAARRLETRPSDIRRPDGRDPQLERYVVAACIAYAAIFTAARIATLPVLLADEAVLLLRAQAQAVASGAAPLGPWLFHAAEILMGNALLGAITFKYACVAVAFIFAFRAAVATLEESVLAALATGSLLLTYTVAVEMQRDLTAGVLMLAAAGAAWLALVAILRGRATTARFALLGLAIGLGGLAATPSLVVALALAIAVASDARARARCVDRRMLLALAIAALLLLLPLAVLRDPAAWFAGAPLAGRVAGLARLGTGVAMAALPVAAFWWLPLRGGEPRAPAPDSDETLLTRVLGRWLVIALALLLALAVLTGSGDEGFAMPLLLPAALLIFARLRRAAPNERRLRRFAWAIAAGALVSLLVMVARPEIETRTCARCAALRDYRPAAQALTQAGAGGALIIGEDREAIANLLVWLPEARGWSREDPPAAIPPDAPGRVCALLWGGGVGLSRSPTAPDWTGAVVRTPPGLSLVQNVAAPLRGPFGRAPRFFSLTFAVVPPAACVLPGR